MSKIRLFWWNEIKLMSKSKENYGDALGPYLVKKISKKEVVWVLPKKFYIKILWRPIYVTIGSVLAHVNENCIIWGSGIIQKNQSVAPATFLAVRGPQTRKSLMAQGYNVPEVYGDPALLLPLYYNPKVEKTYPLGIVPHYTDYKQVYEMYEHVPHILVIDLMSTDIEATTDLLLKCERIVSSSLHGLIVSHAYGIPAVWVEFSDKLFGDGIKFQDYFEAVDMPAYKPINIRNVLSLDALLLFFETIPSLPEVSKIKSIQEGLMRVCPFTQ
jgi:hypothetical protein